LVDEALPLVVEALLLADEAFSFEAEASGWKNNKSEEN